MRLVKLASLDTFEEHRTQWDTLYQAAVRPSIFQSYDWLSLWLSHYTKIVGDICILCIFEDDILVAGVPLYCRQGEHKTLRFIGTGEPEHCEVFSEYQDMLVLPEACRRVKGLVKAFVESSGCTFIFPNVRQDAMLMRLCLEDLAPWQWHITPVATRYFVPLEKGALATSRLRRKARRYVNAFRHLEGTALEFAVDEKSTQVIWQTLLDLHRLRWSEEGGKTIFDHPVFSDFHHQLINRLRQEGNLILARVMVEGRPIAAWYGMLADSSLSFYQSGIDASFSPNISPGTLMHYLMAEYAEKRGLILYDFLSSTEKDSYKGRLTDKHEPVYYLRLFPSKVHRTGFELTQILRRLKRALFAR